MKNIIIFILLIQFFSCSTGEKNEKTKIESKIIKNSENIIVKNIKKTCYKNINTNIYDYLLCSRWLINENDIKEILSNGKKNENSEIINLISPAVDSWTSADVNINNKSYKVEINAMSYYYLTDNKGSRELYTFPIENEKNIQKYFIRKLSEDDDDSYDKKILNTKRELNTKSINISEWKGVYTFDNNNYDQLYKKYNLKLDSEKITFYEGDLPACEIYCLPYINDNQLYLYYDGEMTKCSGYDTRMIDTLKDGDLLFKIIKKNSEKYIQSSLLKYWDEKTTQFKQNVPIKLTK
ncbi:hypothetical protein [Chryseobacterium polytrichastri]|uniref:Uncharacterized protein n=1 Tax=Chryseobacterium polytrichastri TaxID=1302687 RepID=A0A1M6XVC2_9FLAO|nr:hypothetical protein [Chryseobacterium polytrichastri]SHL09927.1 hypothetical protein SAMN05444267_10122 [Chryseobacterium polytrichastri]